MSSLISAAMRSKIDEVSQKLHDTFAVQITVYKRAEKTILTSSPQFNSMYGNAGESQPISFSEVSTTVMARIYFINGDKELFDGAYGTNNKISLPHGSVKIVIESGDLSFLSDAKQVLFDGVDYSIETLPAHANSTGMFDTTFYTFYLLPINK